MLLEKNLRKYRIDMKKRVLFVTPKWCDGKPEIGFCNDFHNHIATFSRCKPEYSLNTIHLDEAGLIYKSNIDSILIEYCKNYKPEIIFYSLLGSTPYNPSLETYSIIKEMGVYQFIFWPDTGPGWGFSTIQSINDRVDLHITLDNPKSNVFNANPFYKNRIKSWMPEDDKLFYKTEDSEKDIPVSFLGTIQGYPERMEFARIVKENNLDIFIGGGERVGNLTPEQYAEYTRRSKIIINFSRSQAQVFSQIKGRVFQTTSCASLLLESEGTATRDFYKTGEDYVEFNNWNDLFNKIQYYLDHPEERLRIANNGHARLVNNYSPQKAWERVFKALDLIKNGQHEKLIEFQEL